MNEDRPQIVVVPPLAFFAAVLGSLVLGWWMPPGLFPRFPWPTGIALGTGIMAAAIVINFMGFFAFRRAGTNVNPYMPALQVVQGGIMRLTRNPMYLGMILFVAGLGLALSNVWGLIAAAVLWAVFHWGVVLREERYMEAKFGAPYRELLAGTRRWL